MSRRLNVADDFAILVAGIFISGKGVAGSLWLRGHTHRRMDRRIAIIRFESTLALPAGS